MCVCVWRGGGEGVDSCVSVTESVSVKDKEVWMKESMWKSVNYSECILILLACADTHTHPRTQALTHHTHFAILLRTFH